MEDFQRRNTAAVVGMQQAMIPAVISTLLSSGVSNKPEFRWGYQPISPCRNYDPCSIPIIERFDAIDKTEDTSDASTMRASAKRSLSLQRRQI
jgi:hypothetical protein